MAIMQDVDPTPIPATSGTSKRGMSAHCSYGCEIMGRTVSDFFKTPGFGIQAGDLCRAGLGVISKFW